ncbi:energy transducer TonB [Qipengyuania sp. YG27]|uniref:Energy transducer TonB n=1 Tax=Qipengyuania mesophila TaxID=2867246 RepID=A0ABS7JXW7_9SPHN|nr:energy transducer TonB [Qipengyuania mesophila]MBX7502493.1 energy transducer TonB [Qipengyuania mesophila]
MKIARLIPVLALCASNLAAQELPPISAPGGDPYAAVETPVDRCPNGPPLSASESAIAANGSRRLRANYPREAERRGWTGEVHMRLLIGCDGKVKDCTVLKSSGHDVLDKAGCDNMLDYARFSPATDDEGRPVESFHEMSFKFAL